jgi:hypothetical protein
MRFTWIYFTVIKKVREHSSFVQEHQRESMSNS